MRSLVPTLVVFCAGACAGASTDRAASAPASVAAARPAAMVREAAAAETRRSPSGTGTVTILARGHNAFLARLRLEAGAEIPTHRDATEEYVHVLEGSGTMEIDGAAHSISPGTTVYMPANAEVRFRNGPAPLLALQVFAGPEPAAKYDGWTPVP